MNKEYIEREKLIRHLDDEVEACGDACAICDPITYGTILGLKSAMSYANTLPAADVAEVVRCKDCVYYLPDNKSGLLHSPCTRIFGMSVCREDSFCSYGERRKQK
jgi:hypothetical protein